MQEIICPICGKAHESVPYKCECGFQEDRIKQKDRLDITNSLFAIYKFSKQIFNKKIEWNKIRFDLNEYEDEGAKVDIQEIFDDRAVAYVDLPIEGKDVRATAGVLAFNRDVSSLIINVDTLDHEMLDESRVKMLFIGDRVKNIYSFINLSLKYIEVDKNNPYFTAENNVLFNKNKTKLIFYCNMKPDVEYTIPKTVKVVAPWAFVGVSRLRDALRVIHCSPKVKFEDTRSTPSPYDFIKIVRDEA